jgi:methylaspartate ammonia-lyase
LDAVAKAKKLLMAEVIAQEYNTEISGSNIHIFAQSGDDRYNNVDKMILKKVGVLPHGLINNVHEKLGDHGEIFLDYIKWVKERVGKLALDDNYRPILHFDVYGTIGLAFNNDIDRIAGYFKEIEEAAKPYKVRIEGPIDMEEREAQMLALKRLREVLEQRGINVEIVADEWCNTLEDIKYFADNKAGHMIQIKTPDLGGINNIIEANLYCESKGIGSYQGGTCNETDRSAQICVHIAMATNPDQILAKPGMGVDEALMIIYNEMQRILALKNRRRT